MALANERINLRLSEAATGVILMAFAAALILEHAL